MRVRIFAVSLAMSAWATVTGAQTEMPRRCNPFVSSGSDAAVSTRPAAMRPYVMPSREAARSFDPSTLWEPVIPDPIGFQNATLVVDPIRHRLIAIGGEGWDGFPLDVFVHPLDPSGTWERLEISGTLPTGVFGGGALYDPVRDRIVVVNDGVWALQLSDPPHWTTLAAAGGGHRYTAGIVYDPMGDRVLTFGGYTPSGGYLLQFLNDVWAFALGDDSGWRQITTQGTPPPPRDEFGLAYDPLRHCMLVFSGRTNDGWEPVGTPARLWALSLDGTPTWSTIEVGGESPPELHDASVVIDSVHDRLLVYGGEPFEAFKRYTTWALQFGDSPQWMRFSTPVHPAARVQASLAYDASDDRLMLFGGDVAADLWTLSGSGPPAWTEWSAGDPAPSFATYAASATWDPVRHRALLFGGQYQFQGYNLDRGLERDLRAIHIDQYSHWTPQDTSDDVPGGGVAIAIDPHVDRLVSFGGDEGFDYGGYGRASGLLSQRALSLEGGWTELYIAGDTPPARMYAAMVADPAHSHLILFGGWDRQQALGDTWILSFDGLRPHWTRLDSTAAAPSPRFGHAMIYDPIERRIVLLGGQDTKGALADVWQLTLDPEPRWTRLVTQSLPTPRSFASTIYDSRRQRIVLFGGRSGAGDRLNDTWLLPLVPHAEWALADSGADSPGGRWGAAAVYDPDRDRIDIFYGTPDPCDFQNSFLSVDRDCWSLRSLDTPPAALTAVPAHAEPGKVIVRWAGGTGSFYATIQRREGGAGWQTVGEGQADASGVLTFEDDATAAATRYEYRVIYANARAAAVSEPNAVDVPRESVALWHTAASPAVDGIVVGLSLPDPVPAHLDVIDVLGRRMLSREVGNLGAGDHEVRLTAAGALPPGIYLVRLTRAGRERTTRVALLH